MSGLYFIYTVFCLVDGLYEEEIKEPLRSAESKPNLSDAEFITMKIVGEWFVFHEDKAIWSYFSQH